MPLTPAQAERVAEADIAIRVAPEPGEVNGAGYGLFTARTVEQMMAWLRRGPPAEWDDQLYNTGIFSLAMPNAAAQHLLFVPGGGNPNGEPYSVAHLPGGRGGQLTLPKVNRLFAVPVEASMPLAGATAEVIRQWVLEQI
ncbi:MAG TPA: hypothetical protein VKB25_15390 [Conexibacter sp.]|nr:hypothetical protein [Conexibacter sp.]